MKPVSLYIHIPWCIQKCPYCDFNSHKSPDSIPENQYITALIEDFSQDLAWLPRRDINTIFIGGGTPSILSGRAYETLFTELKKLVNFTDDIEITLEANPGTVDLHRFCDFFQVGINRLSLGIQSFNPIHLKHLGRIHDDKQAHNAIMAARKAGFTNINLDIMHSLPEQTIAQGLEDITTALSYQPEHLSWYQLTLEPNTVFYKFPPKLPNDDHSALVEEQGFALIQSAGYERYEISAFARANPTFNLQSRHNLNYWKFGDYYGIGAGAHGKISDPSTGTIIRTTKQRQPLLYIQAHKPYLVGKKRLTPDELVFEFMLNASRLESSIPHSLFGEQTFLPFSDFSSKLSQAVEKKLIRSDGQYWQVTALGRAFTNDLQALFLPD